MTDLHQNEDVSNETSQCSVLELKDQDNNPDCLADMYESTRSEYVSVQTTCELKYSSMKCWTTMTLDYLSSILDKQSMVAVCSRSALDNLVCENTETGSDIDVLGSYIKESLAEEYKLDEDLLGSLEGLLNKLTADINKMQKQTEALFVLVSNSGVASNSVHATLKQSTIDQNMLACLHEDSHTSSSKANVAVSSIKKSRKNILCTNIKVLQSTELLKFNFMTYGEAIYSIQQAVIEVNDKSAAKCLETLAGFQTLIEHRYQQGLKGVRKFQEDSSTLTSSPITPQPVSIPQLGINKFHPPSREEFDAMLTDVKNDTKVISICVDYVISIKDAVQLSHRELGKLKPVDGVVATAVTADLHGLSHILSKCEEAIHSLMNEQANLKATLESINAELQICGDREKSKDNIDQNGISVMNNTTYEYMYTELLHAAGDVQTLLKSSLMDVASGGMGEFSGASDHMEEEDVQSAVTVQFLSTDQGLGKLAQLCESIRNTSEVYKCVGVVFEKLGGSLGKATDRLLEFKTKRTVRRLIRKSVLFRDEEQKHTLLSAADIISNSSKIIVGTIGTRPQELALALLSHHGRLSGELELLVAEANPSLKVTTVSNQLSESLLATMEQIYSDYTEKLDKAVNEYIRCRMYANIDFM